MSAFEDLAKRLRAVEEMLKIAQFNEAKSLISQAADAIEWEAKDDGVKKMYTAHEVAELLAEVIGDDCACNVNGNDEWLTEYCDFRDTVCPHPCGVACWEQYLKHLDKRKEEDAEQWGGDRDA